MPAPSSISSSELLTPAAWTASRSGAMCVAPSAARRLVTFPGGFVCAVAFGLLVHGAALMIRTEPVARPALREKVLALTARHRPSLLLAGDSRVECGIIPAQLADALGMPQHSAVNIAEAACDTPAVVAAYRECADRFAPGPLMIVDVSFFAVNDGATDILGDELLWDLSFAERARWVGITRSVGSIFLPEKAIWQDLVRYWPTPGSGWLEAGFESAPGHVNLAGWSAERLKARAEALRQWWYADLNTNGIRWRRVCRDLERLASSDVRLVVVLMPCHPAFLRYIAGTPAGEADCTSRVNVAALCGRLGVPCLEYDAACLGPDKPDRLFHDLVHLNRAGAQVFTGVLARDLAARGLVASHAPAGRSGLEQPDQNYAVAGHVRLD